jgi:hypothetical protein
MAQNHFSDVVNQVQQSPQNQRTERLIDGIAQQMQQSGANRPNNSDRNSNR